MTLTPSHRFVVAIGLMLAVPGLHAADSTTPQPDVTVRQERGVYSVTARFHVMQPPVLVLSVLTDYEGIPRFMPGIKTSIVRERGEARAIVEQEAASRLMIFSRRVHLLLEINEEPHALRFTDRCRRSFTRYEGWWRLSEQDGRTKIVYELIADPAFDVPEFLLKRLLKRDSSEMIEALQREVAARAAR